MANDIVQYGVNDIYKMADAFAKSKLFGIKTVEEGMALCLIAQAEGSHPAIAMRDYQIIQGKPALKADAMLARFQNAGGKVEWEKYTDESVIGKFSHPSGGTIRVDWDKKRATDAGLWGKDNWRKYSRAMLRARVISEAIRTILPSVNNGFYTPEEVHDFEPAPPAQSFNGTTIENEKPNLSMALTREQQEQVYDECLKNINGAADLNTLATVWAPYAKTIRTLDEDLRVDLIQKKDEAKSELNAKESGLSANLSRAEELVNA